MTSSGARPPVTRHEALDSIRADGLVPLFSSADSDELFRLAEVIVESGVHVLEVTLRVAGALDAIRQVIRDVEAAGLPLMVGAGTVLNVSDAESVIDAGARFVFSPIVDPKIAMICIDAGVPWIPGCATPTEIHTAVELGSSAVKLFPADAIGGPGFLRSVRFVFPDLEAIPSGGVIPDAEVLQDWFGAGAMAVAMGSQLFPRDTINSKDWPEVRRRMDMAIAAVAVGKRRAE